MGSDNLEEIIMKSCDLPTIPAVASRVIMLVSDPDASADDLSKAIMADQSMAARVLKLANSSFYGCLRAINTLTQAISIIGFSSLKNIVLAVSTREVYKHFGLTEKMLHEHSSGVAMAAHQVAKETGLKRTEEAFLVGLLHDIGKVVLNNTDADRFRDVMQEVYNSGRSFSDVEYAVYGFTHADVGALVIKKWNLSQEMEAAVRYHHSVEKMNNADAYIAQLASIANLADAFCHRLGIGVREPKEIDLSALKSVSILRLTAERLERLEASVHKVMEEEGSLFD